MFKKVILILLLTFSISYSQETNNHVHDERDISSYFDRFNSTVIGEQSIDSFLANRGISSKNFIEINKYYVAVFFKLHSAQIIKAFDDHNSIDTEIVTSFNVFLQKNSSELLFNPMEVDLEGKHYISKNIFVPNQESASFARLNYCDNLDFSNLDFSNWDTYCATTSGLLGVLQNITPYSPPSLCNGRLQHSLVTGGTDPIVPSMSRTYPGGNNLSVLLGDNQGINGRASIIRRTFNVTAQNNKLIYRYAVVLENPDHTDDEQPFFRTRLIKPDGTYDACADYLSFAGDGLPGWNSIQIGVESFEYRDWTTVLVPLTAYIGQTVTIEISVADCDRGGHFGYAYLTFDGCDSSDNLQLFCENGIYKLKAPDGGISYLWNTGETTPIINLNQPGNYSCTIVPFGATQNCNLTYNYNYQPISYTLTNPTNFCRASNNSIQVNISGGIQPLLLNYSINGGTSIQQVINSNTFNLPIDNSLPNPLNYSISVAQNSNTLSCAVPLTTSINLIDTVAPSGSQMQQFCAPATLSDITVNGTAIQWYANATGGTALPTNTDLVHNVTYYASQTLSSCESYIRLPVTVSLINPNAPTGQNTQSFCYSATINDLVLTGNNLQWYLSATGGTALPSNTNLINNTIYYASQTQNGCESINRYPVLVTITNPQAPTGTNQQTFCNNASIADLSITGNSVQWYLNATGGSPLPNTFNLSNNTTYYASQIESNCESNTRFPVFVSIIIPMLPNGKPVQYFCIENNSTLNDIVLNYNYNLVFYDSPINGNILPQDYLLVNDETIYASSYDVINNCESIGRFPIKTKIVNSELTFYNLITIDQNDLNKQLIIEGIEYFPENSIEIFNRYGNLIWSGVNYDNINNVFKGMANTGNAISASNYLPSGTYFFILKFPNDCKYSELKGFIHIDNKL
jgi:hypothetical protein